MADAAKGAAMDLAKRMRQSPYHRWLGVELTRATPGDVEVRLPFREEFLASDDRANVHGGIISTLADLTTCFAMMSSTGGERAEYEPACGLPANGWAGYGLDSAGPDGEGGRTVGVADVEIRTAGGRLWRWGAPRWSTVLRRAKRLRAAGRRRLETIMRAVVIYEHGGRDKLVLDDVPDPAPARGEILLRVKAVGLNYLDVFVRRGMPGLPIDLPRISGGDVAGEVAALGEGVQSVEVGQRLLIDPAVRMPDGTLGALGESTTGGLSEYMTVSADNAIPLPHDVSYEQAAALPIAYGTAWRMLRTRGRVRAGESVLVLGASGGVGTGAVQIAKMMGCVVFAAASSENKIQRLKELGADYLVNYAAHPEFHRYVRGLTAGEGGMWW